MWILVRTNRPGKEVGQCLPLGFGLAHVRERPTVLVKCASHHRHADIRCTKTASLPHSLLYRPESPKNCDWKIAAREIQPNCISDSRVQKCLRKRRGMTECIEVRLLD